MGLGLFYAIWGARSELVSKFTPVPPEIQLRCGVLVTLLIRNPHLHDQMGKEEV